MGKRKLVSDVQALLAVLSAVLVATACNREPRQIATPKGESSRQGPTKNPTSTEAGSVDFWGIIDSTAGLPESAQLQRLRTSLESMTPEGIERFQTEFQKQLAQSYSWDLWGAAYLINGGCSDDCFDYFRAWLISRGKRVFVASVKNPDSLAELPGLPQGAEFEEIMYVAGDVYKAKTGNELPATVYSTTKPPELGPGWDFDNADEARRRYPKLSRRVFAR